ncbi:hypothetical protein [Curtobacterium sp. MCPF17_052]|uniref:hypothetical protein n=1 Tax=Curtobacterium sp. MCPF17_052 TaxID=2175655 RepID=UPI0024DF8EBD|nr:hypothetical protein [Curtobacterium sp. MCPF17_052]WIB11386.1 hypothetical protein DEJ36_10095 [Curtobacterium sp. MCPF17_052]
MLVRDRSAGPVDTLLVGARPGDRAAVREALIALDLRVTTADGYAASVLRSGDGDRRLSLVLVIALLAFVAAAAGNTLLTAMRGASRRVRTAAADRRDARATAADGGGSRRRSRRSQPW